jgi:uncharacterized protein YraI
MTDAIESRRTIPRLRLALPALLLLAVVPAAARAQDAFTSTAVWLRAGPSVGYPSVLLLGGGTPVTVHGCLPDWGWCDVSSGYARGWVAGGYLNSPYQGVRRPIVGFGAQIGFPIVAFSLNDYWGRYYHDRPWYRDRAHWMHRPPPRPTPPRPTPPRPAPYPHPHDPRPPVSHPHPPAPPSASPPKGPRPPASTPGAPAPNRP